MKSVISRLESLNDNMTMKINYYFVFIGVSCPSSHT